MANVPAYDYSIPNRILPGRPRQLSNVNATTHNDLDRVMLTRPEVLDALVRQQVTSTGMISEIVNMLGGNNIIGLLKGSGAYNSRVGKMDEGAFNKNMKILNHYKFTWRGKAPARFVYKLTRTLPNAPVVTRGGAEFTLYLNKNLVEVDDVFALGDMKTIIKVKRVNNTGADPNECPVTFKLMIGLNGAAEYISQELVNKNSELQRIGNQKSAVSSFGSKVQVSFSEWFTNDLTTLRYQWDATGLASKMRIDPNEVKWLTYTDENQNVQPFWMPVLQYAMMCEMHKSVDNMLFIGKRDITADGKWNKDEKGNDFISGDGFYWQGNARYRRAYYKVDDYLFDDILVKARQDNDGMKTTLLVMPGSRFSVAFDKYLRNVLRANPRDLYWSASGVKDGVEALGGAQGIRSNFKVYDTANGTVLLGETNYFDRKDMPKKWLSDGTDYNSNRAICLNLGENIFGSEYVPPFQLVTMADSWMKRAKLATIADPVNGYMASPEDVVGEHCLTRCGIACYDPNSLMEFYRPINS